MSHLLLTLALLALQEVKVDSSSGSLVESHGEVSAETARCSVRKKHLELQHVCVVEPAWRWTQTQKPWKKKVSNWAASPVRRGARFPPAPSSTGTSRNQLTTISPIYENKEANITDERFFERLVWNGSKHTNDLQDGSIFILNVTFNDTGRYKCIFSRTLMYPAYEFSTFPNKTIDMTVVPELTRGWASILSEVMMYVSLIGLQVWLVIEMIYCYRKISVAGEEALRESAPEYLAIASESKDNCAAVQVAE
ncbi:sodium channel, voltage-gated, type I, beta a isoform X2 [Pseudochaenichthys georgianus]|uniref:sodium channel, voltage-gated, type I, beta a isoform X2 n=1 Tax=Pseudochaenichthys georgianus TaxID=52239 RepID=UPI00146B9AB8|nr:sodium channel, voltage-gated, type I, beta a isoform X2 [Pseudochaenichthys georgianus]